MRYPEYILLDLSFAWLYREQESYLSIDYILETSGYRNVDVEQIREITIILGKSGFVIKRRKNEFRLNKEGFEMISNYGSYSNYLREQNLTGHPIVFPFPYSKLPFWRIIIDWIYNYIKWIVLLIFNNALIAGIFAGTIALIIGTIILKHYKVI